MPWSNAISAEYDALLAGPMGQAMGGSPSERSTLKQRLRSIELAGGAPDPVMPVNQMTQSQAADLWLWRVAYNFYMERNNWWSWRLRDKTVAQLTPLLNFGWQGFLRERVGKNEFDFGMESVWDDRPEIRAAEALLTKFFLALAGEPIETEEDAVYRIIQGMRDAGWHHVTGLWEDYENVPRRSARGAPTFAFDDIVALAAGECHITSNFLVARLRSFNIPAHVARSWTTLANGSARLLGPEASEVQDHHFQGHCFIHFPTLQAWLGHGDDVQDAILATLPPILAMRSEWWMAAHVFHGSEYEWMVAQDYDNFTWWCLMVGRSPDRLEFDVPFLYRHNQLRSRLENVHIENNYAARHGAPNPVPPLFTAEEVDNLVAWVGNKLG